MQRFLSAAFSAHDNSVFTPGLPFGLEPSLGSNIRQGSKTQSSRVIQDVGWVPTMVALPQGAFCLLVANPTKWDFYLSERDLAASTVTHSHRKLQDSSHYGVTELFRLENTSKVNFD